MEQHRNKIEKYGAAMEAMGMTPVSARVYVYLLFCNEPGAAFDELTNYLQVSKSAISNALKMLASINMIEAKTIGGSRKRYFFVNFESTFGESNMTKKFKFMGDMLSDIKKQRKSNDAFSIELENAALFYNMLVVEIPIILDRWKRTIELNRES